MAVSPDSRKGRTEGFHWSIVGNHPSSFTISWNSGAVGRGAQEWFLERGVLHIFQVVAIGPGTLTSLAKGSLS